MYKYFPSDSCHLVFVTPGAGGATMTPPASSVSPGAGGATVTPPASSVSPGAGGATVTPLASPVSEEAKGMLQQEVTGRQTHWHYTWSSGWLLGSRRSGGGTLALPGFAL